MGLSETIIAASIGAAATICTALFQLISAMRAHSNRVDARPKRGNTVKSMVAVVALMLVSAVGGYFFSESRNERTAEDMHSMRDELNAKLQILATTTERLAASRNNVGENNATPQPARVANEPGPARVESVIYAPACQGATCTEVNSQPLALCGSIPSSMQARKFDLYVKNTNAMESSKAEFNQDLGGAKFSGPPVEYPQGENRKAVCVNFLHWSEQPHIATLVLQYGPSIDAVPSSAQSLPSSAVVTTQASMPTANTVSMASQVTAP